MTAPRITIATLKREAARHGATISGGVIGHRAEYVVDAPDGKIWAGAGCHGLCLGWWANESGSPTWPKEKAEAIRDAIERMAEGVAECDDPTCDYCRPESI